MASDIAFDAMTDFDMRNYDSGYGGGGGGINLPSLGDIFEPIQRLFTSGRSRTESTQASTNTSSASSAPSKNQSPRQGTVADSESQIARELKAVQHKYDRSSRTESTPASTNTSSVSYVPLNKSPHSTVDSDSHLHQITRDGELKRFKERPVVQHKNDRSSRTESTPTSTNTSSASSVPSNKSPHSTVDSDSHLHQIARNRTEGTPTSTNTSSASSVPSNKSPHSTVDSDSHLHQIAGNGELERFKELTAVQHKYDPYELTANGRTVLHSACEGGHTDVVIYLTRTLCMDLLGKDSTGQTPLDLCTSKETRDVLQTMIDDGRRKGFKNVVDYLKHCKKKEDEAATAKAMEEGKGNLLQYNIILHGPPGAGKTSVKRLIMGLDPLPRNEQNSTVIVENAVRAVCTTKMKQFKIVKDTDVIDMLAEEVDSYHTEKTAQSSAVKDSRSDGQHEQRTREKTEAGSASTVSTKVNSIQSVIDKVQSSEKRGSEKIFDSHWHHIIDSGGQPQFQDILPLVYQSPSLAVIVLNLTESIDTRPEVCFNEEGENRYAVKDYLRLSNREFITRTCQIAASSGKNQYVIIVCTHKDELGSKQEAKDKEDEWNKELVEIQETFEGVLIPSSEGIIFAVNAMAIGEERKKYTTELQKQTTRLTRNCANREKVPLRWFAYHLELEKGESVMRMAKCIKIGRDLAMEPEDVKRALSLFNEMALLFYFPDHESLKNLVLTKMEPLIGKLSELVKASFKHPQVELYFECSQLKKKGLFDEAFLEKVFKDQQPNELTNAEFLNILKCLKIACEVGKGQYFLPCTLSLQDPNPFKHELVTDSVPLVFSWGDRMLPQGFFFTVVVELLSKSGQDRNYTFKPRNDVPQWREEIQLREEKNEIQGVVGLSNRKTWIKVSFTGDVKHCPKIYKEVKAAVNATLSKQFQQQLNKEFTETFLCPCPTKPEHYCTLSKDRNNYTCIADEREDGNATPKMLCWYNDYKTYQVREVDCLEVYRLLKSKSHKWNKIGRGLGVDFGVRNSLKKKELDDEGKLEEVLYKWTESRCSEVSYDHLIEVLKELRFNDVVEMVKSFETNDDGLDISFKNATKTKSRCCSCFHSTD